MSEERKVPKLRFKGYTDDWKQEKLGDISEINPTTHVPNQFFYIDLESVKETRIINKSFILKNKAPSRAKRTAKKNDIFFQTVRPYQRNNHLFELDEENYVFSSGYAQIRVENNISPSYLFAYIQSDKFVYKVLSKSTGTSYPSINKDDLSTISIIYPSYSEGVKTGKLISKLDKLITLEQEKMTKFEDFYTYLLQNLLPTKNNLTPKIRLKGYQEKWRKTKLREFLSIPVKEPMEVTNLAELLTVKLHCKGVEGGSNRGTLDLGKTKYYKRHTGELIYGKQNFFNGSIAIIPEELDGKASSADVPSLKIDNIDSNFLLLYISRPSYYEEKERFSSGTGSKRIHENTLLNFNISVPSLEEQKSISKKLNLHLTFLNMQKARVQNLTRIKSHLLNQMFV